MGSTIDGLTGDEIDDIVRVLTTIEDRRSAAFMGVAILAELSLALLPRGEDSSGTRKFFGSSPTALVEPFLPRTQPIHRKDKQNK